MLQGIIKAGAGTCLAVAMGVAVGCASQGMSAQSPAMASAGGAIQPASINQGRFPAPAYSQDVEPAYALTGDVTDRTYWTPSGNTLQVGNGQIAFPPAQ